MKILYILLMSVLSSTGLYFIMQMIINTPKIIPLGNSVWGYFIGSVILGILIGKNTKH